MLGDLIADLDRPEVIEAVLTTLSPVIRQRLEAQAADAAMTVADFAAGAVREFVEYGDDEHWFQMLSLIRQAKEPGLVAVQTILRWATEPRHAR